MRFKRTTLLAGFLCLSLIFSPVVLADDAEIQRVLLLSIDGMHAVDLAKYVATHPTSTLARLVSTGVNYTNASTTKPSDSFPGMLAMATGGGPLEAGLFYDDAYDRTLSPPGSACATVGTRVQWKENLDVDPNNLNTAINPANLPLNPATGCTPVYPHAYLKANTIFEVIKAAGKRTAWSDKHPGYEILNGPSGTGVDDLYTPEINNTLGTKITNSLTLTKAYDDLKVTAVLNEINGLDHTGLNTVGVPAIFGMNFQAVSVGQKLGGTDACLPACGYLDASATPTPGLLDALDHTDQSIGSMLTALDSRGLLGSTLVIVSAKHGNSPMDPSKLQKISTGVIAGFVNSVQAGLLAQQSADTISLLWLKDQTKTSAVVSVLSVPANQDAAGIQKLLSGDAVKLLFSDPLTDARTPDIIVVPKLGVVYTTSATKIADHGGFSDDDVHVPILVSNPAFRPATIKDPAQTTQIACTILDALDLECESLTAVRHDDSQATALPGLRVKHNNGKKK